MEDLFSGIRVVLGSASPRRRDLMEQAGIPFEVRTAKGEEHSDASDPAAYVQDLAMHKATEVLREVLQEEEGDVLVIGADTVVVKDGTILGKPKDSNDAFRMIRLIAGTDHQVMTGVGLILRKQGEIRTRSFTEVTHVFVHSMCTEEIRAYIETGEPFDTAGAYGIQGKFGIFVDKIEGDYHNVVGLPIARLYHEIRRLILSRSL